MNINKNILRTLSHLKGEALWLYGTRFSAVILQSITLLIVASAAGSEEFGQFSFMFSAARIMSVALGVGAPLFLQRELAVRDAKYNGDGNLSIFIAALLRMNIFSLLAFLIFCVLIFSFDFEYDILLILLTGYLFSFFDMFISVVRIAKTASFSMVLRDGAPFAIFLLGFIVCLIFDKVSANDFIFVFCISLLICIFIAFWFSLGYLLKRKNKSINTNTNKVYYSFWGGALIGASLTQSDMMIAKYFLSELELGGYAVLRRMTNLISLPQIIVNWSINIDIAKKFITEKKSVLQELAIKGLYIAVPVSLIMLIGMLLLSPVWLSLFDVVPSFTVYFTFVVLSIAQLINVMSGANLLFALQCNEEKYIFKFRLISLIVGILIMIAGGFVLGMPGLAIGATFSIILLNMLVTKHVRKKIGIWTSIPLLRFGNFT